MANQSSEGTGFVAGPQLGFPGSDLCVAFANTAVPRTDGLRKGRVASGLAHQQQPLDDYADLIAWGLRMGFFEAAEADRLRQMAEEQREMAAALYTQAMDLRKFLLRICTGLAAKKVPSAKDLKALNAYLTEEPRILRVVPDAEGFAWVWQGGEDNLERTLWLLACSAAQLLTTGEHRWVKQCGARDCRILFVDRSPGHRRVWCDMKTCGNRVKTKRFVQRHGRRSW